MWKSYLQDVHQNPLARRYCPWDQYGLENGLTTQEQLVALGLERAPQRVLDLGCGTGEWLRVVERLQPPPFQYTGVDFAQTSLEIGKHRSRWSGASFVLADIENLPFQEGSFDLVSSHLVLHLQSQFQKVISEAWRVLAPNGAFLALVPAPWKLESSPESLRFKELCEVLKTFEGERPKGFMPKDAPYKSEMGFRETYGRAGFLESKVEFEYQDLLLYGRPAEVLNVYITALYNFIFIPDAAKPQATAKFLETLISWQDKDGNVRLRRPMVYVKAFK